MPFLLKRSQGNLAIYRKKTSPTLVEVMQKAQGTLHVKTVQPAKQIVFERSSGS